MHCSIFVDQQSYRVLNSWWSSITSHSIVPALPLFCLLKVITQCHFFRFLPNSQPIDYVYDSQVLHHIYDAIRFVVVELSAYWFHVPQSWHWPKGTAICLVYNIIVGYLFPIETISPPNSHSFPCRYVIVEVWRIIDFVWWKLLSWWQNSAYSVMHYTVGPGSNNKLRLVAIRSLVETLIILHSASPQ